MATVNWLWIGNQTLIDSVPTSVVTQAQLDAAGMTGYVASGPAEIAAVDVSGTTTYYAGQQVFTTAANPVNAYLSLFNFDSPSTAGKVYLQTINTTFRADVMITLSDGTTTNQVATVVQMSNGDIFMRPHPDYVAQWDGITSLQSITITTATPYPWNTTLNSTISFKPTIFELIIPCFAAGTLIKTPTGQRRVEALQVGDWVETMDHGPQQICWIGARAMDPAALNATPRLRPIRIAAGALGDNCPAENLLVSPQHRLMVQSPVVQRMFNVSEVLVAAKQLVGLPGIAVADDVAEVTYVHFLCDCHEVVFANGAPAESLYVGKMAMAALGQDAASEILGLFPELVRKETNTPVPARVLIGGREGRSLTRRPAKHAMAPLLQIA